MERFTRAKFAHSLWWFLAMPLYRTLSKPKTRFEAVDLTTVQSYRRGRLGGITPRCRNIH